MTAMPRIADRDDKGSPEAFFLCFCLGGFLNGKLFKVIIFHSV